MRKIWVLLIGIFMFVESAVHPPFKNGQPPHDRVSAVKLPQPALFKSGGLFPIFKYCPIQYLIIE